MALSKPLNSSFGEFPSSSPKVIGATRVLTITELQRIGTNLQPTGVEFKFGRENFSAPRGPQAYGVQLRTARQDLPGGEEPVEQVLGWNYTPFTVTGVWDDRYAGNGYAEQTRKDFEALVKRGNLIRYQFEQVAIIGLVTHLNINYRRQDLQGYSFTISPHFRFEGESVRLDPNKNRRIVHDPKTSVLKARQALEALKASQDLATLKNNTLVQSLLKTAVFSDISTAIDTVDQYVTKAETTVDKEILQPGQDAANALNRGAQAMASVKTAVSTVLNQTRQISATAHMAITSLVQNLKFESWHRSVSADSRGLVVEADQTQQDFLFRAQPKPQRLHRVRQGESLYQISTRYYGTPHHWRDLLVANHLSSIVLRGGELLEIPEIKL